MYKSILLLLLPVIADTFSIGITRGSQTPLLFDGTPSACDCNGTKDNGIDGTNYICRDRRLGPVELPKKFPFLSIVSDYDRFGGKTPGDFLGKWWNFTSESWSWPSNDGFYLDQSGNPIKGNMTLPVGTRVDRFGAESGKFVAAADAPYNQRALPPNSLDHSADGLSPYNYHIYKVIKPLIVEGGPVTPWFGQPGLGAQFYVGRTGNITTLLKNGFLETIYSSEVEPGPGAGGKCGL